MPPPNDVVLGPLTQQICSGAKWFDQDAFPAHQSWANEIEDVLEFANRRGLFAHFLPRLRDMDAAHRHAALAELRSALFLVSAGFELVEWEPQGMGSKIGEFAVRSGDSEIVFVEVKAPGWQGELAGGYDLDDPAQRKAFMERKAKPKFISGEARSVDPAADILDVVIRNAVPKMRGDQASLVVVLDDLFFSALESPFAVGRIEGELRANSGLNVVGGILLIQPFVSGGTLVYRSALALNNVSLTTCRLPDAAVALLEAAARRGEEEWAAVTRRNAEAARQALQELRLKQAE